MPSRILIIEDDSLQRELLGKALTVAGFDTDLAGDGEEGLTLFLRNKHGLVVTDIIMPEREGLETIRAIKKHDANTIVIAMSGGGRIGSGAFLDLAAALGADITLAKPFRPSALVEAVRTLLGAREAACARR